MLILRNCAKSNSFLWICILSLSLYEALETETKSCLPRVYIYIYILSFTVLVFAVVRQNHASSRQRISNPKSKMDQYTVQPFLSLFFFI